MHILNQLQSVHLPGIRTILISPSGFHYYSGMISGYIEGLYKLDDIRISLDRMTQRAGIEFLKSRVVSLDPAERTVLTDRGEVVSYDVVSFDIGSQPAGLDIPGAGKLATALKPYETIPKLPEEIDRAKRIVVVGGGASGIETALVIQARRYHTGNIESVILISAGELLPKSSAYVTGKMTGIVREKGIRLHTNDTVTQVFPNQVQLNSGKCLPYDRLLWLVGPRAPTIFSKNEDLIDEKGYLLVDDKLQSVKYSNIFGAGDCITITGYPNLDKAGVYAVREAPILWHNLRNYFGAGGLRCYKPQRSYLSILSTGGHEALLQYKGLASHGRWCWQLKRRIDEAFVRQFQ